MTTTTRFHNCLIHFMNISTRIQVLDSYWGWQQYKIIILQSAEGMNDCNISGIMLLAEGTIQHIFWLMYNKCTSLRASSLLGSRTRLSGASSGPSADCKVRGLGPKPCSQKSRARPQWRACSQAISVRKQTGCIIFNREVKHYVYVKQQTSNSRQLHYTKAWKFTFFDLSHPFEKLCDISS